MNRRVKAFNVGIANVKDFAKYLIKEIESLPKTPNGYSKVYDESMMINIIESRLENYLSNIK